MLKAKTLASLFILVFAVPSAAQAGLDVYPADGPVPKVQIEQPKPLEYKVKKGDTVAVIAKKFSIDAKTLMAANGMTDARRLKAGKTLQIPGVAAPARQPAPVKPAPVQAAASQPAATAQTAPAKGTVTTQSVGSATVAEEKADATARKARKKGEALDPGIEEDVPVKGKKGKRGKQILPTCPPPTITIDDKTRASFGKTGVIMNTTDVPQTIRDEFLRYANKWVDELETIGVGTFHAKKIRQVGSEWEASYRVILRESLGAEVKKVNHEAEDTPYVGHITYVQRMFTSVGPTKQAALAGPYTSKDECVREIFSYSGKKKAWR